MISAEDDSLHDPGAEPRWVESARFPFTVAERAVGGWVALVHRPDLGVTVGGLAVWDPTADAHDCLYLDWGELWATEKSWNAVDCELPSGLTARTLAPLEAFHFSYLRDECQADLTWVAGAQVPDLAAPPAGGGRFAQPGRMSGTIAVRGDILHVECGSVRHRAWGPVATSQARRTDAAWALDDEGDGFHLVTAATSEVRHDPVWGSTERLVTGWQRLDGVTRPLVSARRRVLDRDDDGSVRRVHLLGVDDLGRELSTGGDGVSRLRWPGRPGVLQTWTTVRWKHTGGVSWGQARESAPLELTRRRDHRRHPRARTSVRGVHDVEE